MIGVVFFPTPLDGLLDFRKGIKGIAHQNSLKWKGKSVCPGILSQEVRGWVFEDLRIQRHRSVRGLSKRILLG
jgi:hypothetical protein